jgi:hypothetical protein
MSGKVLYEGKLPISLAGFDAGQARVVVRRGESVHPPRPDHGEHFLVAEANYAGTTYEVTCGRGGVPEVLEELKSTIEKDIEIRS